MTTSGLPTEEITTSNSLYRTLRQPGEAGESLWRNALLKTVGVMLHVLAPIGYEDESGFWFGEQPGRGKGRDEAKADAKGVEPEH